MDTLYNTELSISLVPHYTDTIPVISYGIDTLDNTIHLHEKTTLKFSVDLANDKHQLLIKYDNNNGPNHAVEIESVTIEGLTLDRFKWNSRYYPVYPEPWASEQTNPLPEYQESATYMGWNGIWIMYFEVPVFPWIHRLENLGWLYS
jgi:hypothetical protein